MSEDTERNVAESFGSSGSKADISQPAFLTAANDDNATGVAVPAADENAGLHYFLQLFQLNFDEEIFNQSINIMFLTGFSQCA